MANIKIYIEVNADILGDQGILDVIKTPIDGINRHPNIRMGKSLWPYRPSHVH